MSRPAVDPARYDPIIGQARAFIRAELGIDWTGLNSHRRQQELVRARALFVRIVIVHGPDWLNYSTIGWWLGGRDHSTIIHMWREIVPSLMQRDAEFRALCEKFTQQLEIDQ